MKKIEHNYKAIQGWFNMEEQYQELIDRCPEYGTLVELGAWKGKSTSFMATEILNQGRRIQFITVDTFKGVPYSADNQESLAYQNYILDDIHEQYLANTNHLREHYATMISDSAEAANMFPEGSINCLFIDAGHSYDAVMKDLIFWYPKMAPKSVIAGHDYNDSWPGVVKAVNDYFGKPDKIENNCWFKYIDKNARN